MPNDNDSITTIGGGIPGGMGEDHISFQKEPYYEGRDAEGRYHPDNPNQAFWHDDGVEFIGNPYGYDYPQAAQEVPLDFYGGGCDTISFTADTGNTFKLNMNENDKIDLNLESTSNNGFWKYEEDLTMKDVRDYLSGTYRSHYTSQDSKTQTLDLIESIGDGEAFCRSNAIKYLSRFGKKNGKSKMDILKAIHYCILLYHFAGLHKPNASNYPY